MVNTLRQSKQLTSRGYVLKGTGLPLDNLTRFHWAATKKIG